MRRFSGGGLPVPGKPFGPYVVDLPIGQGGMGAVYRARDPKLGRALALKVMLPSEAADSESRARFMREARLAAALEHPGIVRIYEVGEVEGTPYIAMEWLEGKPLRRAKIERPVEVLTAIAETLAYAHDKGVIHRDLKPGNVMVDAEGRPKLVDFGIAKRLVGAGTFATRDGMVLGTPQYMAPEQELSSAVDARADQYAWGVLAYELLTGERPTKPALAHAALDEHHGAVVMRALSVAPSDRFASMRDLLAAWRAPAPTLARETKPRAEAGHAKLYAATVAGVTCVGLVVASLMWRSSPKVPTTTTTVPTNVEAPVTVSEDASVAADADAEEESDDAAAVAPPPSAKPRMARPSVRALGSVIIDGSADLERPELFARLREARPALERCVVGLDIPVFITRDEIRSDVYFHEHDTEAHVLEVTSSSFRTNGTGGRGGRFPPPSTSQCLTAIYGGIKITRPKADSSSYARIVLELRR